MQPCDPQKERKARREAGSRRSYFPGRSKSCRRRSCRSLRTEPAARDRDGIHCNVRRRGIRSFLCPTLEALGAEGGTTIGVAAATFGLLLGSLTGGPVAERLIKKYNLKSTGAAASEEVKTEHPLNEKTFFDSVLLMLFAAFIGSYISKLLSLTGLNFPYYVGLLFGGALVRNIADARGKELRMFEIDTISNTSLNLFLSMALMSLDINKLINLALPMIVILLAQAIVMMLWAYFVTFRTTGMDYDAAVMAAGHCGVGLGQTPNAVANMSAVIEKNGPAPTAWFVLPVVTVIFINIMNPIIITAFINWLA